MVSLLHLILFIPAVPLMIEDFRERRVHLIWLIAFSVISLIVSVVFVGVLPTLKNIFYNSMLLIFTGAAVGILFCLKERGTFNTRIRSVKNILGAGDMIFLFAITPLFGLRDYVVFMIAASVFSLAWWLAARVISRRNITIPFIGTAGILLCVCMIIRVLW